MFILLNMNSDNKTYSGFIYDNNSNEALTGVRIISDVDTVYTDFDGYFEIDVVSDTTKLQYSLISYEEDDFFIKKLQINLIDNQLVIK